MIAFFIVALAILMETFRIDRRSIENCTPPQLVTSVGNCSRTSNGYTCDIITNVGVWRTALKNFPGDIVQSGDRVYTCDMMLYGKYYEGDYRLVCKNSICN